MDIQILSIFPEIFSGFKTNSLIEKAISKNLINLEVNNIRDFATGNHQQVDDTPYGGGPGMVMKPEALSLAIEDAKKKSPQATTILLSPSGKKFDQAKAKELAKLDSIIFVCGRYEGIDQRVIDTQIDQEISIGDYVLMGGEIPSMVICEAIIRLLPRVLGNSQSTESESFNNGLLEYPQYTKPSEFKNYKVPEVLLSGDHAKIEKWRHEQALSRTQNRRPDLLRAKVPDFSVILLHDNMNDKQGKIVTTSLTLNDIHDMSRNSRTFGAQQLFVAHTVETMRLLGNRMKSHWEDGNGAAYNPDRAEAFKTLQIVETLDQAISKIEARTNQKPILVATSAKTGPKRISYTKLRNQMFDESRPYLIMLGTGWGMSDQLLARADLLLDPILGPTDFNHLSVRCACAIILDRLFGS